MENIIKKAIEGEYRKDRTTWDDCTIDSSGFYSTKAGRENRLASVSNAEIVCDPLFWRALGIACRWGAGERLSVKSGGFIYGQNEIDYALRFHEINLTKGWNAAVEYLKEVTS